MPDHHGSVQQRRLALSDLSDGYKRAIPLTTAVSLGVFQQLARGAADAAELASALGTDERNTGLLCDALTAMELLRRDGDGRYALHGLADEFLRPGADYYMGDILEHNHQMIRRWADMEQVVRSGEPMPRKGEGRSPRELRAFIMGMQNISRLSAAELADALDLGGVQRILDLAGGPGTYLHEMLLRLPAATGAVLDLPEVVEIAREESERLGLDDRVELIGGSMFEAEYGGPWDMILLGNIVHSWSEQENRQLTSRIAQALAPGGRLVIKDFLLDESGVAPEQGALFSLNMMMANRHGRSYRRSEVQAWLEQAGLEPVQLLSIGSHSRALVARRP